MLVPLCICAVLHPIVYGKYQPVPKVVGGQYLNITDVPYSAAFKIKCLRNGQEKYWGCGSSILNQRLLLTAAHCTTDCDPNSHISVSVGDNNKYGPNLYSAYSYFNHQNFDKVNLMNDIALVRLKNSIKFSSTVGRVALMKNPPHYQKALIAGWGFIDEINKVSGNELKALNQFIWKKSNCKRSLHRTLEGIICASSGSKHDYPSIGDSGSALVVKGYIQIGLVSFKKPRSNLIYYSDIAYFYEWIKKSTVFIFCGNSDAVVLM